MRARLLGTAGVIRPAPRRADGALDVLPAPYWVRRLREMGMPVADDLAPAVAERLCGEMVS